MALFLAESLDFDIDARWEIELHQRVHRVLRGFENIEQPLMGANLELLARFLIYVRRAQNGIAVLERRQRNRPGARGSGALGRIDNIARRLVQDAVIVRLQPDSDSFFHFFVYFSQSMGANHSISAPEKSRQIPRTKIGNYDRISVTVPAPTVLPPSRIAKRRPLSMAIGVISSISSETLSPGRSEELGYTGETRG